MAGRLTGQQVIVVVCDIRTIKLLVLSCPLPFIALRLCMCLALGTTATTGTTTTYVVVVVLQKERGQSHIALKYIQPLRQPACLYRPSVSVYFWTLIKTAFSLKFLEQQ